MAAPSELADELRVIQQLCDEGILTGDMAEEKKRAMLGLPVSRPAPTATTTKAPTATTVDPALEQRVRDAKRAWRPGDKLHKGKFTSWEDAKYIELLKTNGQPLLQNPRAREAFLAEFGYRTRMSVLAHVNAFNIDEYKAWRKSSKGEWAGFDLKPRTFVRLAWK